MTDVELILQRERERESGGREFELLVIFAMDENTVRQPLLLSPTPETGYVKNASFSVSLAKLVLRVVMWMVFILWVAITFLLPAEFTSNYVEILFEATGGSVFGITGLHSNCTPFFRSSLHVTVVCLVI